MDNKQIKDGVGNLFTLRMRDRSPAGDGSFQQSWVQSTLTPIEYGTGGVYQYCGKSGVMTAGLAASSPIYSFHWPASLYALIRRVRVSAWTLDTAFAGGLLTFDMYAARSFTVQYGAGHVAVLGGDNGQLRTSMAPSQAEVIIAVTASLSPGTATLDQDPLESRTVTMPATAKTHVVGSPITLFEKLQGEHPYALMTNEGFVIKATVPPVGTWGFSVTTEWDEVSVY
jgi:hypothetical protein